MRSNGRKGPIGESFVDHETLDQAGVLDDLASADQRAARLQLLEYLSASGLSLDELQTAAAEERLALLPVERLLA